MHSFIHSFIHAWTAFISLGEQFASDESNHLGAVRALFTREDADMDKYISLKEFTGPKTDDHSEL